MTEATGEGVLSASGYQLTQVAQQLGDLARYCSGQSGADGTTPVLAAAMEQAVTAAGGFAEQVRTGADTFAVSWGAAFAVFEDSAAVMSASAGGLAVELDALDRRAAAEVRL